MPNSNSELDALKNSLNLVPKDGADHEKIIADTYSSVSSSLRFSDWIKSRRDDLEKAGDGYEALSELSKKCIDYAVDRYIAWLKAQ